MLIFAESTHFTNTLDFDTGLDSFDRKRLNSSEKSCYWHEIIHFLYEVLDLLSGHDIWKPWTGKEVSSLICHSFLLPSSLCHFISSSCLLPLLFFVRGLHGSHHLKTYFVSMMVLKWFSYLHFPRSRIGSYLTTLVPVAILIDFFSVAID